MKSRELKFETSPDDLKVGEAVWDSAHRIQVFQLWEGQIWNFYDPFSPGAGNLRAELKTSVFVPASEDRRL